MAASGSRRARGARRRGWLLVELGQRGASYTFGDPAVERLSPAQKQLLRMGPRNVRIVKAQLWAIARELGIPESRLPTAAR